ncbi:hypothetical protein C8N40_101609 [Pontibacter mucosus]|uniref:Uncharacterized protein n=1 Tax=Pontibacter mucosus TaxID=1649266 RepID=A0A2T5YU19_9BACT|nr:hypothetical protein [Pontibacter mucosus]PTX22781.1 hypothetical protein C8N40_101609 [Pontibacter mucosus]
MSRGKYKKLYYVPGLISLVLLPLLLVYFGRKEIQKLDLRVIEINFWNPSFSSHWHFPERNYEQVILTGNVIKDNVALENAKLFIKKLYASEDTLNGIQFTFQDSASYGSFVGLINYFKKEDIRSVLPYGNNLWVSYPAPPKRVMEEIPIPTECLLCDDVIVVPPAAKQLTIFEQFQNTLHTYSTGIQKLWPTIALLAILITLTITQITRRPIATID